MTDSHAMSPNPSDTEQLSRMRPTSVPEPLHTPAPLTDERLAQFADDPLVCCTDEHRSMAAELRRARALLAAARLTEDDLTAMHRGLIDHARTHTSAEEQQTADTWLSGYSEGVEHALDTVRLRAATATRGDVGA